MAVRGWSFRRGVLVGVVVVLVAQYAIDESPFADWLVSPLLLSDTTGSADVIVVAGAGLVGPCEPNLSAVRRVLKAATLWQEGRAPYVLFTGGAPPDLSCAVSDVMADLAGKAGIPRDRILTEGTSRSTRENAYYAVPVLESLRARSVILVTDRLHMLRASQSLAAMGYAVGRVSVPVYATHRGNSDMLTGAAREFAALAYYWGRGWLSPVRQGEEAAREGDTETSLQEGSIALEPAFGPVIILGASYAQGWPLDEVAGAPVVNKGMAGQQAFEMAERFDRDVLAHAPRAVVLWGFINDVFRAPRPDIDSAMAHARDSFSGMISKGREAGVDVVIATEVTITGQAGLTDRAVTFAGRLLRRPSYPDYVNARVRETNAWIRQTAREKRLLLLDLERVVSGTDGPRRREFAQPDGSHLTDAAYAAITRYSRPILERHFRAKR